MSSKYFGVESPSRPHLNKGQLADLREDVDRAFLRLEADLEDFQPGGIFDITSFTPDLGNSVEVGVTVSSPQFTASYTKVPSTAEVADTEANPPVDVILTPTAFTVPYNYQKTTNNQYVDFTLSATKDAVPDSSVARITWSPKGYWGVGPAGYDTEVEIKLLANKPLVASRVLTFTVTAGSGEYVYYAYPASYGAATFKVDGWEGGFDLISSTISVTSQGVTQNYRLYRSTNANLGTITVQVS